MSLKNILALKQVYLPLVLSISLAATYASWKRLQAADGYQQVVKMKTSWQQRNEPPRDRVLHGSFTLGYRTHEKDRSNADAAFLLASLHAWREKGLRLWPDQAKAEREKIIQNIKASLALRPTWFDAWITLALVKYQGGQIDRELLIALDKAIDKGRYESSVHHGVSIVGLGLWSQLEPGLKDKVVKTLKIALRNSDVQEFVVERIVMNDRIPVFQETLASNERLRALMEKYVNKKNRAM